MEERNSKKCTVALSPRGTICPREWSSGVQDWTVWSHGDAILGVTLFISQEPEGRPSWHSSTHTWLRAINFEGCLRIPQPPYFHRIYIKSKRVLTRELPKRAISRFLCFCHYTGCHSRGGQRVRGQWHQWGDSGCRTPLQTLQDHVGLLLRVPDSRHEHVRSQRRRRWQQWRRRVRAGRVRELPTRAGDEFLPDGEPGGGGVRPEWWEQHHELHLPVWPCAWHRSGDGAQSREARRQELPRAQKEQESGVGNKAQVEELLGFPQRFVTPSVNL